MAAFCLAPTARGGLPAVTMTDSTCDALARRTDPGGNTPYDPALHRLIELEEFTLGSWAPAAPAQDVFLGDFAVGGGFLRLDLVLSGLVNPPGSVDPLDFNPFKYGDNPVYGFVEIDMDNSNETGGELDNPQYRYLGNIARFGGIPADLYNVFEDRVAEDASAFDGDFLTEPYVERHGEEFHLALLGGTFGASNITEHVGNGDLLFDAGETWRIEARWFHRAHGFEPYSFASGGGEYTPLVELQFEHDPTSDQTRVSLVFPLTNVASALMRGEIVQGNNANASDQASLLEAFVDLVASALYLDAFPTGMPEEEIIIQWQDRTPTDHLDPTGWRATVLLGTSYTSPHPAGEFFVWTDASPNVLRGDVDGENGRHDDDRQEIEEYIIEDDGLDGTLDGVAMVLGFADNFRVYDLNQDGKLDAIDVLLVSKPGDCDDDGDVDLADFQQFQVFYTGADGSYGADEAALADLDMDRDVDLDDLRRFGCLLNGPDGS